MEALRADASRLLVEYDSSNSAGNRLQRRLLNCEHAFQLLNDRFRPLVMLTVVIIDCQSVLSSCFEEFETNMQ